MRKIRLLIAIIILGLSSKNNIYAQTGEINMMEKYQTAIKNLYSGLDEAKIHTGILMERAIPITNIECFNATDTCWYTTASDWVNSYMQIYYGHLNPDEFYLDTNLLKYPQNETINNEIPFGILFYDYNTFSEEALKNGYIEFDTINSIISDISGHGINPYDINTCFVASPLIRKVITGTYTFNISNDLFLSNKFTDFDNISIDFGDGSGFKQIYLGSFNIVNYMDPGTKEILVIAQKGDLAYHAKATLNVVETITGKSGFSPDFGPEDFEDGNSSGITAEYAEWYACDNDSKEIRKPYVIVSGYDPDDKNRFEDEDYKINLYRVANRSGYLDKLREDGYDIILYRSKNSLKSIISNAKNLVAFIEDINSRKTSDNELVVVGASMGGIVVRYALTYMEYNNIDHQTKLFISMDSPQLGANVPLGFQHMFNGVAEVLKDLFPLWVDIDDAVNKKMLDGTAAKQMLLYHYTETSNNRAYPSSSRVSYLSNLQSIGNFPQDCRTIAISQGSGIGTTQGFSSGTKVLEKDAAYTGGGLGAFTNMRLEFEVRSVPNNSLATIFKMKVSWQVCVRIWVPFKWITVCDTPPGFPTVTLTKKVQYTKPYDNAPGSKQGFHNLKVLKSDEPMVAGIGMDEIITFMENAGYFWHDNHYDCFIPTFSSLALNTSNPHIHAKNFLKSKSNVIELNDNTYFNFDGENTSLFDVLYLENINNSHIYHPHNKEGAFSRSMLSFMSNETSPDNLTIENMEVSDGQAKTYEARNSITIGENIDDLDENNGKIIVHNGAKLTLSANNSVTVKPGFEAYSGSEVHIKPDAPCYCSDKSVETAQAPPKYYTTPTVNETKSNVNTSEESLELYELVKEFSKPIVIYPNPAKDNLYISSDKKINKLKLYDVQGKLILKKNFERKEVLNISHLKSGTYFIEIIQENGEKVVEKIIKQ